MLDATCWANYYWAIRARFKGFGGGLRAQDDPFFPFLALKLMFLSSGTSKIGSGMSYLYIGRSSRGRLTYQIAGNCHFCGLFGGSPDNYPSFRFLVSWMFELCSCYNHRYCFYSTTFAALIVHTVLNPHRSSWPTKKTQHMDNTKNAPMSENYLATHQKTNPRGPSQVTCTKEEKQVTGLHMTFSCA